MILDITPSLSEQMSFSKSLSYLETTSAWCLLLLPIITLRTLQCNTFIIWHVTALFVSGSKAHFKGTKAPIFLDEIDLQKSKQQKNKGGRRVIITLRSCEWRWLRLACRWMTKAWSLHTHLCLHFVYWISSSSGAVQLKSICYKMKFNYLLQINATFKLI